MKLSLQLLRSVLSSQSLSTARTCDKFSLLSKQKVAFPAFNNALNAKTRQYCDSAQTKPLCTELKQRSLVRVCGEDAAVFLQGLMTNDVRCLDHGCAALYSMMLNVQGRVLYDLIVYNLGHSSISHEQCYFIECDSSIADEFIDLMRKYRIRKKVDLTSIKDEYSVWAILPREFDGSLKQCDLVPSHPEQLTCCASDPRLKSFGCRMIVPVGADAVNMFHGGCDDCSLEQYHTRRYQFGIGEGIIDLPPGHSFPLESNAVFLNGVSFNKGCYIGQELTARTHHTGVIRKRLMPIILTSDNVKAEPGDSVENFASKNCGKFRNNSGIYGLALLRVAEAVGKGPLSIKHNEDVVATADVKVPHWWPKDHTTDEIPGYKISSN